MPLGPSGSCRNRNIASSHRGATGAGTACVWITPSRVRRYEQSYAVASLMSSLASETRSGTFTLSPGSSSGPPTATFERATTWQAIVYATGSSQRNAPKGSARAHAALIPDYQACGQLSRTAQPGSDRVQPRRHPTTMTTHSANSDLNPHVLPSHAPARRWVRSRLTKSAAALAVVLMTGASTTAVAEAATNGSANASKTSAASTFTGHRGGHPGPGGMSASHGTPPAAAGTVESVGTGSFTLKNREGTTVIVDVTSSTTYRDQKVTSPTFVNITAGEMVSVEGTTTSGVVTASSINLGFGGFGGRMSASHGTPPTAAGTVESVGTGTFTLKNREGTMVIVDVTSSTTYKDRTTYKDQKVTSPSFVNITAGEMVSVEGTATSGVVTATTVTIGFGGGMWGHGRHQGAAAAGSAS